MPSYLHPGVYVEEIPSGSRPIEGVSTSTAAFVGVTRRKSHSDPVVPELIGSLSDYLDLYGPVLADDAMGHAVQAFYQNGGGAAYICPLSTASNTAFSSIDVLDITAVDDGPWGSDLYIKVYDSNGAAQTFTLGVGTHNSDGIYYEMEKFEGASVDSTLTNYIETLVNGVSNFITVSVTAATLPPDTAVDGVQLGAGAGGQIGDETAPVGNDYSEFYDDVLRKYRDVRVIIVPGRTWNTDQDIISRAVTHCDKMKNCMVIVDPDDTELVNASDVNTLDFPTSTYTALYYPWIGIANPLYHPDKNPNVSKTINIPASSMAAGMWAKIDAKRGVWKAPAGVEAQLSGASSLRFHVENLEQDQLNPLGVNCIRKLPGYGSVFWGARTLATNADPEWRYVPVRRTAIYIEESIYNGIQWAVFEPNDEPLWASLRANIGAFMNGMFRAGAFQGTKANDAYFVRCGLGDTMTQADIDRGQVIALIGFAPLKPAEFVIVRIQQKVGEE